MQNCRYLRKKNQIDELKDAECIEYHSFHFCKNYPLAEKKSEYIYKYIYILRYLYESGFGTRKKRYKMETKKCEPQYSRVCGRCPGGYATKRK